jgi:hypothetical protein
LTKPHMLYVYGSMALQNLPTIYTHPVYHIIKTKKILIQYFLPNIL